MNIRIETIGACIAFLFAANVAHAQLSPKRLPILNGSATYLPKPRYPQAARDSCADGRVDVEVLVGQTGRVSRANAVRGDQILFEASVNAARRARFRLFSRTQYGGLIVDNFDSLSKCVKAGIVNKKALSIPKPIIANFNHPKHLRISEETAIDVQVVINESEDVTSARTLSGHPLIRVSFEKSASGAKFPLTLVNAGPVRVTAIIRYILKPTGEILY